MSHSHSGQVLTGRACAELCAREFWRDGNLIHAFCVVFIKDEQDDVWQIFFDDECGTWKLEATSGFPEPDSMEGDDEISYRIVDLLERLPVKGDRFLGFTCTEEDGGMRAKLRLQSGRAIVFDHVHSIDKDRVRLDLFD